MAILNIQISSAPGKLYEVINGEVTKYYSIAGMTVAMSDSSGMKYLLTDQLGSVVAVTNTSGALLSQQRYLPFGGVRTDVETISETDFGYTGQRALGDLGLMDYHARMYDASLGRFVQPDSIIPNAGDPQSFNRYSYVINNPLIYTDPTGQVNQYRCNYRKNPRCNPPDGASGGNKSSSGPGGEMSNSYNSTDTYCSLNAWDCNGVYLGPPNGSSRSSFCDAIECSGIAFGGGFDVNDSGNEVIGDGFETLSDIEELFNWSETTPGEMTLAESPGYPLLGGARFFYQPFYTLDNGSPFTIGPTSIGFGSATFNFNGSFRYKEGLNSITALGISVPLNFQPWSLKVNMDTNFTFGKSSFTERVGVEYTARPDNLTLATATFAAINWGPQFVVLATKLLSSNPSGGICISGKC